MARMTELRLLETIHPTRDGSKEFEALLGIDSIKEALIDELMVILDRKRLEAWTQRHHANGLGILDIARSTLPLILLSGDVGCGKTALASCVATPVARAIDQRVVCLRPLPISEAAAMSASFPRASLKRLPKRRRAPPLSGVGSSSSTRRMT